MATRKLMWTGMSNHLKISNNNNNSFTNNHHHDLNNNIIMIIIIIIIIIIINGSTTSSVIFRTMSDDLVSAKLRSAYRAHYPIKLTGLNQIIFSLKILSF